MTSPLKNLIHHVSNDAHSWKQRNWAIETEIPVSSEHPGSFLYKRKHHIHEGVDLYCCPGQEVVAMSEGVVTNIIPFTGEIAGTPHWNDTYGVVVEDSTGVWIYGEIVPSNSIKIGLHLSEGDTIGSVITVLKHDKGRPTTMLHLERYCPGTINSIGTIPLSNSIPNCLMDPVPVLLRIIQGNK